MKLTHLDSSVKIFGIPNFEERKTLERLPQYLREAVPSLKHLGRRPAGARLCFRTDAPRFSVKINYETMNIDIGMSIYACQSAFVYVGERSSAEFVGIVYPKDYSQLTASRGFGKAEKMQDVTVFLPRNEVLKDIEINIPDGYSVEEPTPYKYSVPVLYYGSSITEGGCCCNVSNAYSAILSRKLDCDYINLGFSGNAKGELPIADFINTLDISCFVYDYDHNAPTVEHLESTHEPFFRKIREKNPTLPIIMMTRPKARYTEEEKARREVVRRTYENAKTNDDENVYFLDGEQFFTREPELCLIDGTHPNDFGFHQMAEKIEPLLKSILEKTAR